VRKSIGAYATPDFVILTPGLPKTRSGKIMRRILRKIIALEVGLAPVLCVRVCGSTRDMTAMCTRPCAKRFCLAS
jgi:hypothetical protein